MSSYLTAIVVDFSNGLWGCQCEQMPVVNQSFRSLMMSALLAIVSSCTCAFITAQITGSTSQINVTFVIVGKHRTRLAFSPTRVFHAEVGATAYKCESSGV